MGEVNRSSPFDVTRRGKNQTDHREKREDFARLTRGRVEGYSIRTKNEDGLGGAELAQGMVLKRRGTKTASGVIKNRQNWVPTGNIIVVRKERQM